MKLFETISHLLYPPRCAFCGEVVSKGDKFICDKCSSEISYIDKPCLACGKPKKYCKCAGKKRNEYLCIVAPFVYSGLPKSAVLRLKRKPSGAFRLASDIVKFVNTYYDGVKFDLVTSVPTSSKRLEEKGFNHAGELAKQVADLLNVSYAQVLTKIYETPSQHGSNKSSRSGNVKGAFDVCESELVKNKTILIIDDVSTTGATLNECALMLNLYGADAVYTAVVAVAVNTK